MLQEGGGGGARGGVGVRWELVVCLQRCEYALMELSSRAAMPPCHTVLPAGARTRTTPFTGSVAKNNCTQTCMWQSWSQMVCGSQWCRERGKWELCTGNLPPSCAVSSVCRSLRSSTLTSNTSLNHPGPPKFNILAPLPYSLHLIQPSEHPHNHPQGVLASSRIRSTSVCGSSIASGVCDGVILFLFGLFETIQLTQCL